MLSSIHPLGERGRHNRWIVTVTAFTFGSTIAGALVGGGLGALGQFALTGARYEAVLMVTVLAAIAAGVLDMANVKPVGPVRQVNETWIGHYRGWIYGGAFGMQLGSGVATYVVTWGVYATFVAEVMTVSTIGGALVGALFGLGRSVALLSAGMIDSPSRLTRYHEGLARLALPVSRGSAIGTATLGLLSLVFLI